MVVRKGIELVTKKCNSHDYILGGTQQLSWKGHPLDPFVESVIDLWWMGDENLDMEGDDGGNLAKNAGKASFKVRVRSVVDVLI